MCKILRSMCNILYVKIAINMVTVTAFQNVQDVAQKSIGTQCFYNSLYILLTFVLSRTLQI
jgi:hypothetical protein